MLKLNKNTLRIISFIFFVFFIVFDFFVFVCKNNVSDYNNIRI